MNAHKLSLGLLPAFLTLLLVAHVGVALAGVPGTAKYDFRVTDMPSAGLRQPALDRDNTMYVGADDHRVYAINSDGTIKWIYETGSPISTNAAIYYSPDGQNTQYDGRIYVGLEDGHVLALDVSGKPQWMFYAWHPIIASPALAADGTIYVGRPSVFIAINPDGSEKWSHTIPGTEGGIYDPAVGPDGTIYVAYRSPYAVYAFDPDGGVKWVTHMMNPIRSPVTIGRDGTLYFVGGSWDLIALWPNGDLKWRHEVGIVQNQLAPVIGHEGMIYVSAGRFLAINPDGSPAWDFTYQGHPVRPIGSAAVDSKGFIYFPADDGRIYCAAPNTGTCVWRYFAAIPGTWMSASVIGSDGLAYSTGTDYVRALYTGATGPFDGPWPMYRRDAQCTARLDKLWSIKDALRKLLVFVAETDLGDRLKRQLVMRVKSAMESLDAGLLLPAVHKLGALVNHVQAQEGKKISEELADVLIRDALRIIMMADSGHP